MALNQSTLIRVATTASAASLAVALAACTPSSAGGADGAQSQPNPDCTVGTSTIAQCLPDSELATAVAEQLDKGADEPLTTQDVASLTHIESDGDWDVPLGSEGIVSLAGIGVLENLKTLALQNHSIKSLEDVVDLVHLESLDLSGNYISKMEGLSALTSLKKLDLSFNQITEVDTKELEPLTKLGTDGAVNVGPGEGLSGQLVYEDNVELDDKDHFWMKLPTVGGTPIVLDPDNGSDIVPAAAHYTPGDVFASFFAGDAEEWTITTTDPIEVKTGGEPISYSVTIEAQLGEGTPSTEKPERPRESHGSATWDAKALAEEGKADDPDADVKLAKLHAGVADPQTDVSVVLVGSSTAAGGVVPHKEQGWSYRLGYRLGGEVLKLDTTDVFTGGTRWYHGPQGGTTAASYLPEERRAKLNKVKPDYVIHQVGSNDWGTGVSPEEYGKNLRESVDRVSKDNPGVIQILIHQQPRFDVPKDKAGGPWEEYGKQMQAIVAEDPANRIFKKVDSKLLGYDPESGFNDWGLVAADRIHMMANGNRMFADYIGGLLGIPSETGVAPERAQLPLEGDVTAAKVPSGSSAEIGTLTLPAEKYPRMVRVRAKAETKAEDQAAIRLNMKAGDQSSSELFPIGHVGEMDLDEVTSSWVYVAPDQELDLSAVVESTKGEVEVTGTSGSDEQEAVADVILV